MQSYKLVILIFICKGYHFSIESIMKGVPFLSKMHPPRIISLTKHVFVFQVTVAGNVVMIFNDRTRNRRWVNTNSYAQGIDDTKQTFNLACVYFQPLNETLSIGRDAKVLFRLLFLLTYQWIYLIRSFLKCFKASSGLGFVTPSLWSMLSWISSFPKFDLLG